MAVLSAPKPSLFILNFALTQLLDFVIQQRESIIICIAYASVAGPGAEKHQKFLRKENMYSSKYLFVHKYFSTKADRDCLGTAATSQAIIIQFANTLAGRAQTWKSVDSAVEN